MRHCATAIPPPREFFSFVHALCLSSEVTERLVDSDGLTALLILSGTVDLFTSLAYERAPPPKKKTGN